MEALPAQAVNAYAGRCVPGARSGRARAEGRLRSRIVAALFHPRGTTEEERDAFAAAARAYPGDRLRVGPLKLYIDDVDPMIGICTAVTRRPLDGGDPWQPAETVDVATAVYGYTMGSAYANFLEVDRGSLTVGKAADFVVLSRDILAVAPKGSRARWPRRWWSRARWSTRPPGQAGAQP
ncbi:amidohydrolase family protein [Streptomyces sp. NPDC059761]|uniref:amidohydrolase family protein n=1 Tax=Streptomyces sp. NPDC059761 TaxID=3346937 RepID=UPI003654190F